MIRANLAAEAIAAIGVAHAIRFGGRNVVVRVERVGFSCVHDAIFVRIFQTVALRTAIGVDHEHVCCGKTNVAIRDAMHRRRIGVRLAAIGSNFRTVEKSVVVAIEIERIDESIVIGICRGIIFEAIEQSVVIAVGVVFVGPVLIFDVIDEPVVIGVAATVVDDPVAIVVDSVIAHIGHRHSCGGIALRSALGIAYHYAARGTCAKTNRARIAKAQAIVVRAVAIVIQTIAKLGRGHSDRGIAAGSTQGVTRDLSRRSTSSETGRTRRTDVETIVDRAIAILILPVARFSDRTGQKIRNALQCSGITVRQPRAANARQGRGTNHAALGIVLIDDAIAIVVETIAQFRRRHSGDRRTDDVVVHALENSRFLTYANACGTWLTILRTRFYQDGLRGRTRAVHAIRVTGRMKVPTDVIGGRCPHEGGRKGRWADGSACGEQTENLANRETRQITAIRGSAHDVRLHELTDIDDVVGVRGTRRRRRGNGFNDEIERGRADVPIRTIARLHNDLHRVLTPPVGALKVPAE